jgi:hypothetical protein
MSVVVRKYPTGNSNPDSWTNPTNIYTENNACAFHQADVLYATYKLYGTGFGFAIPSNAILDNIRIGGKVSMRGGNANRCTVLFQDKTSMSSVEATNYQIGLCAATVWITADADAGTIAVWGITVNDINTEDFWAYVQLTVSVADYYQAYCDCLYVEVTYHLPPSSTPTVQVI